MSQEPPRDEPLDALPVEEPHHRPTCWHCGSDDISRGLHLGVSGEAGEVGIQYHATGKVLGMSLLGLERLRVSLCNACGTVVRLSVKETDRNWT
jgi:hypothetical protein